MSFLSPPQKAIVDHLGTVLDDVEARMMLGTIGLFADDQQFGVVEDDSLYFRVDDESRSVFASHDTEPYRAATLEEATYLAVPDGVIENEDMLTAWAQRAIEAAETALRDGDRTST